MKRMIAAALLALSLNAWADEASQRKAIDELLTLTQAESMVTNMRRQLDAQTLEMITRMAQGKPADELNDGQKVAAKRFSAQIAALLDDNLSWVKVKEFTAKVYLDAFTEAEVVDLVEFYKTPLGQKMLAKMPVVMEATARNTRVQLQAMLPRLEEIGRQFATDFEQASPKEKPAAKPGKAKK